MSRTSAEKIKGWCRVVYLDASLALMIGTVVTCGFLIAGAGVLGAKQIVPQGETVAVTLSNVFSSKWGSLGGILFMLSGAAALIGTLVGQFAGWPRLLADSCRICIGGFGNKIAWKTQYRFFLIFFLCTNMIIVFVMRMKPVILVKFSAILDGLLLTPLQAIWIAVGLFFVMPRMLSREAAAVLRPSWIFLAGLIAAFLVFGYFCVFQIPYIF